MREGLSNSAFRTLVAALVCAYPVLLDAQTSRDSAGIRITTITLAAPTGVMRLAPRPTVDIGGNGGPQYELSRVRSVLRLSNGTLVVANGATSQLRFFDASGKYLRDAGRKGSGPGEFTDLYRVFPLGRDSMLAFDALGRRIVVFDGAGAHVRTAPLMPPDGRREPSILGALNGTTLIAASSDIFTLAPRPQAYVLTRHLFTYGLDGHPIRDVGSFTDRESFVQHTPPPSGGTAYWDLAFGRKASVAPRGGAFLAGDGTTFELRSYSSTGALREILRADVKPQPVSDANKETYKKEQFVDVRPGQQAVVQRMVDEMPYPRYVPAFERVAVASDGRIWIKRYQLSSMAGETWIVLDGAGHFVDEVTLPVRFHWYGAGADFVFGVYRDADDVEHVQVYRVGR